MNNQLTGKQQAFVEHYTQDPSCLNNGHKSAVAAGYSVKTALAIAAENLSKPIIKEAIKTKQAEIQAENVANKQQRQQFWTRIMLGVASIQVNMGDRLKASELLGRSEADFTDKYQDTGKDRLPALTPAEQERYKLIAKNLSKKEAG